MLGRQVFNATGDGFCLLNAVTDILYFDFGIITSTTTLMDRIVQHMADNSNAYAKFYTGSRQEFLFDMITYFQTGNYCTDVVDLSLCILTL